MPAKSKRAQKRSGQKLVSIREERSSGLWIDSDFLSRLSGREHQESKAGKTETSNRYLELAALALDEKQSAHKKQHAK